MNDFCRFCKKNLRIHGQLTNSASIFEKNSKGERTNEQVLRLGLRLHNTSNRSCRICRPCKNLITRLERDLPVFKQWTDDEGDQAEEACSSESSEKRERGPTPSKTPRALKKFCPNPSTPTGTTTRRSITEVFTHYPSQTVGKVQNEVFLNSEVEENIDVGQRVDTSEDHSTSDPKGPPNTVRESMEEIHLSADEMAQSINDSEIATLPFNR
ncbi:unnamed protein product [Pleuronectes platessa]|uniref:Uncharacterized protein n=1 Tax=Pleuronectes platessa TaxID=8262 RepID=A0A9N7UJQ1_PLEPL|nr:unnamed protein product [Pleuronectes platessa]